jgi:hypothetical protein
MGIDTYEEAATNRFEWTDRGLEVSRVFHGAPHLLA